MGLAPTRLRVVSLRTRLLVAATLVLAGFVMACAAALERVFEDQALQTQRDRLQSLAYALLAAAEPTADGHLSLSSFRLPDSRLQNPGSGLEAALLDQRNALAWGSVSLADDFTLPPEVDPGEWIFGVNDTRFVVTFGLRWLNPLEGPQRYSLVVMEDRTAFNLQMRGYRRTLWGWLLVAALALLSVQGAILAWGLGPLRRLGRELARVEQGQQPVLEHRYPQELLPLAEAINGMIRSGHAQLSRQRNALEDLAHSLKTPLAVLRSLSEDRRLTDEQRSAVAEPVDRMQRIVDHQLRQAVVAGQRTLTERVPVPELLEKLGRTLAKVYAARSPTFEWSLPPDLRLRMDSGDLYELMGNLLENAVKYGGRRVAVSALRQEAYWTFTIEDDGPGFPENPERLLQRGVRADTLTPGQGIGLAASLEIVKAYGGSLHLGRSERLGGAQVRLVLGV